MTAVGVSCALGLEGGVVSTGRPPGGDVADTWLVTNASGIRVVGKTVVGAPADMFQAEAEGLTVLWSQPPLMPYWRRITIRRQSGGGSLHFPGHVATD